MNLRNPTMPWSFGLALLLSLPPCITHAQAQPPNIVFIMIDDLGWSDLGCYGNEFVETPNIDQLASEGIRFSDFYAAGAVCSPTRASIQSGQNQARFGLTDFISGHWRPFEKMTTPQTALRLPAEKVTIAEMLQQAGYQTGYFGKWHLASNGRPSPQQQGYDTVVLKHGRHFGFRVSGTHPPKPEEGQYLTDYLTDRTIDFIEENQEQPFFAFLSHYAVHIPLQAPKESVEKYRSKPKPEDGVNNPVYAAMIEQCDRSVGRIVDALEKLGLTEETLFVFTSDNGGLYKRYGPGGQAVTSNTPLRDEKGSLYEGGIRVPLIIRWPGVTPKGATSSAVTISHDFYPTFAAAAKTALPANQPIDGRSLLPLLEDPSRSLDREAIYFHYPHYHHSRPAGAVRSGPWKLIEFLDTNTIELYQLEKDVGESRNLADAMPVKARQLRSQLHRWRKSICAAMPTPNPAFDQARRHEWWNRRAIRPINMEALEQRWDGIAIYPEPNGRHPEN